MPATLTDPPPRALALAALPNTHRWATQPSLSHGGRPVVSTRAEANDDPDSPMRLAPPGLRWMESDSWAPGWGVLRLGGDWPVGRGSGKGGTRRGRAVPFGAKPCRLSLSGLGHFRVKRSKKNRKNCPKQYFFCPPGPPPPKYCFRAENVHFSTPPPAPRFRPRGGGRPSPGACARPSPRPHGPGPSWPSSGRCWAWRWRSAAEPGKGRSAESLRPCHPSAKGAWVGLAQFHGMGWSPPVYLFGATEGPCGKRSFRWQSVLRPMLPSM